MKTYSHDAHYTAYTLTQGTAHTTGRQTTTKLYVNEHKNKKDNDNKTSRKKSEEAVFDKC